MTKPFFTIIIPTLNEEQYLPRLLESLVKQTFKNFTVVVIDGSSIDQTREKALKYKKLLPNLNVLKTKQKNVSIQRNIGAQNSKSKYLLFLDADAQVQEHFLQEIYICVIKRKAKLLTTNLTPDLRYWKYQLFLFIWNIICDFLNFIGYPVVVGSNLIVNKDVFLKSEGFNPSYTIGEDSEFVRRLRREGIRLHRVRTISQIYSMRRFYKMGFLSVVKVYIQGFWAHLKKDNLTRINYSMGGHIYQNNEKTK